MGCINEKAGTKEEVERTRKIDSNLRKEKKTIEEEIKILLLGAGESGKSTFAKQMKIIHLKGFTEEERHQYREIIHSNIISSIRSILMAGNKLRIDISPENKKYEEMVLFSEDNLENTREISEEFKEAIQNLWNDPKVKEIFSQSSAFQLPDTAAYFFNEIDRITTSDYLPSPQDILMARVRTTGITEITFNILGVQWRTVDVGGQRNERKKWIHCFQEVTALLFFVATSEYDLKLYEDEKVNRMIESINLFSEMCNCQWFAGTAVILFLNKSDLFRKKIKRVDLNVLFDDYSGGRNFDNAIEYLKNKFTSLRKDKGKCIYTHVTCATNTENMKYVFNSVRDIIIRESLMGSALI